MCPVRYIAGKKEDFSKNNKLWQFPYSNKFVNKIRSEKMYYAKNTQIYSVCKEA